jgi:hypothetical protein
MATGIITILISLALVFLLLVFLGFGNPIAVFFVKGKMEAYAADKYSEYDLQVDNLRYDWKTRAYKSEFVEKNDGNIYFEVFYYSGHDGGFRDSYETDVLSGWNTTREWQQTFTTVMTPILQKELADNFISMYVSLREQVGNGQPFDKDFPVSKDITLTLAVEDIEPSTLSNVIIKCRDVIHQNGFNFSLYNFKFEVENSNNGADIFNLKPEYINDELVLMIEDMQDIFDSNGYEVYYQENGASYSQKYVWP